jgi:nitrate reductase NapAB chaperone NapD
MILDIEAVKKLLEFSKQDIYVEDFIGEKGIDEDSEKAEMIFETFNEIQDYVIGRLQLRLTFMEVASKEQEQARKEGKK